MELKALKQANFQNHTCGASGFKEIVRFASSFICKRTEAEIPAEVIFYDDKWDMYATDPAALSQFTLDKIGLARSRSNLTRPPLTLHPLTRPCLCGCSAAANAGPPLT